MTDRDGQLTAEAIGNGWDERRTGPRGESWTLMWDHTADCYWVAYAPSRHLAADVYYFTSLAAARRSFAPLVAGEEPWNQRTPS